MATKYGHIVVVSWKICSVASRKIRFPRSNWTSLRNAFIIYATVFTNIQQTKLSPPVCTDQLDVCFIAPHTTAAAAATVQNALLGQWREYLHCTAQKLVSNIEWTLWFVLVGLVWYLRNARTVHKVVTTHQAHLFFSVAGRPHMAFVASFAPYTFIYTTQHIYYMQMHMIIYSIDLNAWCRQTHIQHTRHRQNRTFWMERKFIENFHTAYFMDGICITTINKWQTFCILITGEESQQHRRISQLVPGRLVCVYISMPHILINVQCELWWQFFPRAQFPPSQSRRHTRYTYMHENCMLMLARHANAIVWFRNFIAWPSN